MINFYGTARINYLIKDGQGGSISNLVELTIDSVNDAPIATFATDQNTAEGNSAIGGQLTSTDVDTHATAAMTGNIPNPESAEYSYVSAFIDDFDSSFAAGELSATLKHADGTALLATETVQFVDAKFTTSAGVTTEVTDIASIGGLTIDPNGSLTLDTSGAFYDGLATADDLIEIIVEYSIDNSDTSTSTTNEFRIHVTSDDEGTTREASFARGIDFVDGLTINPEGDWTFNPSTSVTTNDSGVLSGRLIGSPAEADLKSGYSFVSATLRDGASDVTQGVAEGDAGLTINDDGTFSFDPQNAAYDDLTEGDIRRFDVVYALTGDGQTVEQNLVIEITGTDTDPRAEIIERCKCLRLPFSWGHAGNRY